MLEQRYATSLRDDFLNGPFHNVNLSTNNAASSSTLLANVRAERLARERQRGQERAVVVIQRFWRAQVAEARFRLEVLESLENGQISGVEIRGRALVVLFRRGWASDELIRRRILLLSHWFLTGQLPRSSPDEIVELMSPTGAADKSLAPTDKGNDWSTILAMLSLQVVQLIGLASKYVWIHSVTNIESDAQTF